MLNSTDVTYTEESVAALKSALEELKTVKTSLVTEEDPLAADVIAKYGTDADPVRGYGSVKNAEDKDGSVNRFKKGLSTLLDKTIYLQVTEGKQEQSADYTAEKAPVIKGLDKATKAVVDVMNALETVIPDGLANEPAADGNWYYYKNNKVADDYTGLAANAYGWWYIQNGKVDFNATGLTSNEYGWWYVQNGTIDFKTTGLAANEYGWWYVEGSKINFNYTGLVANEYGWWYVEGSKINFNHTGLVANEYGWWYVEGGKINFNYTGSAANEYGLWNVKNGRVDFN